MMRTSSRALVGALMSGLVALGSGGPAAHAAPVQEPTRVRLAAAPFVKAPKPVLTGTLAPGQTVTVNPGAWSPAPAKVTYTFYKFASNGYRITLQSGSSRTYTLKNGDNTYRLKVEVTAERAGYATTRRVSDMSLHVLIPAQRSLVAGHGGDWHDMYFAGRSTDGRDRLDVTLPRAVTHAYVEFSCRVGAGDLVLFSDQDRGGSWSDSLEPGDAHTMSTFWLGTAGAGERLVKVGLSCAEGWSLTVRPVATAPTAYAGVSGFANKAVIYTGPGAYKTFAAYPGPSASWWVLSLDASTRTAVARTSLEKDGQRASWVKIPAGPALLSVTQHSFGPVSWRLY